MNITVDDIKNLQSALITYRLEVTIFDKKFAANCIHIPGNATITIVGGTEFDDNTFYKLREHYAESPAAQIPKMMTKFIDPKLLAAMQRLQGNPPFKPLIIGIKMYNCSTNELVLDDNYSTRLTGGYWTRGKMTIYIDSLGLALSNQSMPDYWQLNFVDVKKLETT